MDHCPFQKKRIIKMKNYKKLSIILTGAVSAAILFLTIDLGPKKDPFSTEGNVLTKSNNYAKTNTEGGTV